MDHDKDNDVEDDHNAMIIMTIAMAMTMMWMIMVRSADHLLHEGEIWVSQGLWLTHLSVGNDDHDHDKGGGNVDEIHNDQCSGWSS